MGKRILGAAGGVRSIDFYGEVGNRAKKKLVFGRGSKMRRKRERWLQAGREERGES